VLQNSIQGAKEIIMRAISVRILFACFIVVAGLVALGIGEKEIVMFCLGAAAGYIAPKPVQP